ncbi:DUF4124 domain-containing protein [Granulosicoccaceae sp. 1_MG-2023]|nr:DUF4124 domain-containing protein [Granulosicoccaceae sp. 1_MG-2023]
MAGIFFKLLFKALTPVLILVGVMSYMMSLQGQDPAAVFGSLSREAGQSLEGSAGAVARAAGEAAGYFSPEQTAQRIYRWVDADGVTQFGTEKPPGPVAFSELNVDPDVNVMQPYRAPRNAQTAAPRAGGTVAQPSAAPVTPGLTANPLQMQQMLEQVNSSAEQRLEMIDRIR